VDLEEPEEIAWFEENRQPESEAPEEYRNRGPDRDGDDGPADRSTEQAARRYSEGDEVDTPAGIGVVTEIRTEAFEGPAGEQVEPSDDSPAYIIATQGGAEVFRASDLRADQIEVEGVANPTDELDEAAARAELADRADLVDDGRRFDYPESWEESPTPNRVILLKAWAGLGGRFTSCRREMAGEVRSPARFCASMKDRVLNWEGWRQ